MNLLLTGGAGYIGSACLRYLLRLGHNPVAFDDLSQGNVAAVPEPGRRLVVGDLADTDALAAAMVDRGIEAVLHFAALASVPESIGDPEGYYLTNVLGTKNVLDAMRQADVPRIVFSSTAAVYGFDNAMPLHEGSALAPETPYGTTKLAAERMIKDYARAYGFGYAILRYFNAAGADADGEHGEHRRKELHLIPLILQVATGKRDRVRFHGGDWDTRDGTCIRDYVHVEDLAQAHALAVERLEPGVGLEYNLGSGTGTTVLEVLRACEAAVGRPIRHEIVGRRAGDPATLVASAGKIAGELGWEPRHREIGEIVATAWRWHRNRPGGYDGPRSGSAPEGSRAERSRHAAAPSASHPARGRI